MLISGQLLTRLHQAKTNNTSSNDHLAEMVDKDGQEVVSLLNQPGAMMDQGKHRFFLKNVETMT